MAEVVTTPFVVRVKDITDVKGVKGDDFSRAYVKLTLMVKDDTDVSDLKEAVMAKFKWRKHREDAISLFLVAAAGGQKKPTESEEETALKGTTELDSVDSLNVAGLKSGCFVLAKCAVEEVADNVARTPADRDGGSVLSPSAHSGMVSLHSNKAEADASAVFLQVAHESFPAAALLDYQDRLLTQTSRPVSNRVFTVATYPDAFQAARQAYCTATLDPTKSPPKANVDAIDFSPAGDYTNRDYTHVEFDCIVKVPLADNAEWSRDPALTDGVSQRLFFIAPQGTLQSLPARPAPVVPEASSEGERQPSAGTRSAATSFSLEHYPPGATHYIVGEVYSPLGEGNVKPFQKLLQAERNLQFLKAKEKGTDVRACILGLIFLGPHMSAGMGAKLYNTLKHYQDVLPCLWELQQPPCRLLGCMVTPFQPAIAHLEVLREVRDLSVNLLREVHASKAEQKAAVAEQKAAVEKAVAEQKAVEKQILAAVTALSEKLDSALAPQKNRGE